MSEDMHEKIGMLRGQVNAMIISQQEIKDNISKVFQKIDEGNRELTSAISAASVHLCNKEHEIEQLSKCAETTIKQVAIIHNDIKPIIHEFKSREKSKMRLLYERSEVKIMVAVAFIVWIGAAIKTAAIWIYETLLK